MGDLVPNAIRLGYFIRTPNVGDLASPMVVRALTGQAVRWVADRSEPHLLAVGSVLAAANPVSQIWGSGIQGHGMGVGQASPRNIHALRGRLSHIMLRKHGLAVPDVPLGDPGFLLPGLLGIARAARPRFRVGLVSHYVDRYHPVLRGMMAEPGVCDLNIHVAPEIFLQQMAACATIISTSLHGLIFAEALGIPNLWLKASDEIGGGSFKFQDWYSLMARPQIKPHLLRPGDSALALADRAEIRESRIDVAALKHAFPHQRLQELTARQPTISVEACRARPLPVFLISFNRGPMLQRSIASLRTLSRPTEIIVQDNGSTDPVTLQILAQLEESGIQIIRRPAIRSADELNQVNQTVQAFFSSWGEPARYIVSDCDIDLSIADPDVLDIYDALLDRVRQAESVGPMLRIRDIPLSYPLYHNVMNSHIEFFWRHRPKFIQVENREVAIQEAVIDTTLALHRAGETFKRLKKAIRVYFPFEALHLDWYTDPETEAVYFKTSDPEISHWNNRRFHLRYRELKSYFREYYAVRQNEFGGLVCYTETVKGEIASRSGLQWARLGQGRLTILLKKMVRASIAGIRKSVRLARIGWSRLLWWCI